MNNLQMDFKGRCECKRGQESLKEHQLNIQSNYKLYHMTEVAFVFSFLFSAMKKKGLKISN